MESDGRKCSDSSVERGCRVNGGQIVDVWAVVVTGTSTSRWKRNRILMSKPTLNLSECL